MSDQPKSIAEMVGETLRECGVLLLVFGMLDPFLKGEPPGPVWTLAVVSLSLLLLAGGITLERRR
jgi:hypothetical protein